MTKSPDVVVIGAGIIGCAVAYYLAREGATVTLLEREAIGSGASAHATGSLSLLGTEFSPGPSFQFAIEGYREFQNWCSTWKRTPAWITLPAPAFPEMALDEEERGSTKEPYALATKTRRNEVDRRR